MGVLPMGRPDPPAPRTRRVRGAGEHDLEPSPLLGKLVSADMAHPAAPGETWDAWSAPRSYGNRLFHSLNWAVTGRCNHRCGHCFMADGSGPMLGQFSWEECVALLDECERCGIQTVTLTGGEPMLHPDFMGIVRECARRRICVGEINANGSLLTPAMLDELRRLGMDPEIKVSFDGVGHHDWLRGVAGAEGDPLDAMRLAHGLGFRVRAQTNAHRGNLDAMPETVELLDAMGVEEVRVIRTTETPRWRENAGEASLGVVEYYDAMLDLMALCVERDFDIAVDTWQFVRFCPQTGTYEYHPVQIACSRYRDGIPACKGARGEVAVAFTGEVYPCNQMSGTLAAMGKSLGNVHETPLHELLVAGAYHDTVMLPVSEIRTRNEPCRTCRYWTVCGGGCRAIALAFTEDYRHFDPTKCLFFKGGYLRRVDEVFARAHRPYRCVNDTGDLPREGEPGAIPGIVAALGAYA